MKKGDTWLNETEPELASPCFEDYRARFETRPPDLSRQRFPDEVDDMSGHDDVVSMTVAPAGRVTVGAPKTEGSAGRRMHIWLVTPGDVLVAEEEGAAGRSMQRRSLAHTNLSGGGDAHAGGELWYRDESSLWLTGGSGRYPPRSAAELDDLVASFRSSGYAVCSAGWDHDVAGPSRYFRDDARWLDPHG